jgi:hypothetical protein
LQRDNNTASTALAMVRAVVFFAAHAHAPLLPANAPFAPSTTQQQKTGGGAIKGGIVYVWTQ